MLDEIKDNMVWGNGIVLENIERNTEAVVRANREEKTILIKVKGAKKREYFYHIRCTLFSIFQSFPHLNYNELIPLPGYPDMTVSYNEFQGYVLDGRTEFYNGQI